MDKVKHTPGPWRAVDCYPEHPGTSIDILGHPDYAFGGEYFLCRIECTLTTPSVTTANARLIAAAPELLAVALKCEECRDNGWEWGALIEELQDIARSAIAKATGN